MTDSERSLPSRKLKVAALSLGRAVAGVSVVAVFALLSRWLSKTEYAAFRQTLMVYMTAAPMLSVGLNQGIFYFLPSEKKRIRGRVFDVSIVLLFTATLFCAGLLAGGNQVLAWRFSNPIVADLLILIIPFVFANVFIRVIDPVLTVQNRVIELSIFSVVGRLLIAVGSVVPVLFWVSPTSAILGQTVASVCVCLMGLWLVWRFVPQDDWKPQKSSIVEMLKFSFPLGLAATFGVLNVQLDKFVVSSMKTPEEFAVFSNGAIEIPLIGILTGSIVTVLMVDMRNAISDGDKSKAISLFRQTAFNTSYVLFPAAIYLFILAKPFMVAMFTAEYLDSSNPFRIYLLLIPIRTVAFGALLLALGLNIHILIRGVCGLMLNFALSIALVTWLGSIGAAISTVLVVLLWAVPFNLFFLSRRLETPWFQLLPLRHLGRVAVELIAFAACMLGIVWCLSNASAWTQLAVSGSVAVIWMVIWWNGKIYDADQLLARLGVNR